VVGADGCRFQSIRESRSSWHHAVMILAWK
jgi:hypothetical protein